MYLPGLIYAIIIQIIGTGCLVWTIWVTTYTNEKEFHKHKNRMNPFEKRFPFYKKR